MDLREITSQNIFRHPWETSRLKAINEILKPVLSEQMEILDIGCGDGFVARGISDCYSSIKITAADINLTDEIINNISKITSGSVHYSRYIPDGNNYDLILLLDVLEHVRDDSIFLKNIVERHINHVGKVLITVPMFQCIFSNHDIFLGHLRRYNMNELERLVTASNLTTISSGYLFFSLLLPKLVYYRVMNRRDNPGGAGNWRWGALVTSMVNMLLDLDNWLLFAMRKLGITLPGLSGWILCEKKQSA